MENKIEEYFDKLIQLIHNVAAYLRYETYFDLKDTIYNLRTLYNDNIKQNSNKKKELEINTFVVFDEESCTKDDYEKYYKEHFPYRKTFVYLGEIKQVKGHCILCDLNSGKIIGMCHTENFREATEDEY